ncbi:MAG: gliding motility-associated C-terminal domain-containing protein, partial [Bacteroidota bacterium]
QTNPLGPLNLIGTADSLLGALQLAPDGKIYTVSEFRNGLGEITNPDQASAGFTNNVITLMTGGTRVGLPNFIPTFLATFTFAADSLCFGDSTRFVIGDTTGVDSVRWTFGDPPSGAADTSTAFEPAHQYPDTGTYQVALIVWVGGVADTVNGAVTISGGPVVSLGADTSICPGNVVTLDAGTTPESYLWQDNSTAQTLAITDSGTYSVLVTNQCGVARDTIRVDRIVSNVQIELGNDTTLCPGETVLLDPGQPGLNYTWSDNSTGNTLTANASGLYVAEATDGCTTDRDSVVVTVADSLLVDLPEDTTICEDSTLVLRAFNPGATYQWQDGSTDSLFVVDTSGNYRVTVFRDGCEASDSLRVSEDRFSCIVDIDCQVDVPNVFSPNGDGFNDEFRVFSTCTFQSFRLTILNRWGHTVYDSENPNIGWDGTANGQRVPAGVYFWVLEFQHNVVVNLDRLAQRGSITVFE